MSYPASRGGVVDPGPDNKKEKKLKMNEQSMTVAIRTDYIELYKLLKLADLVASGGEAKYMISEGMVSVNSEAESRKRRKIVARDTVEYNGRRITVISAAERE